MHKFRYSFSCAPMKKLNTSVCFVLDLSKQLDLLALMSNCCSLFLVSPPSLLLCHESSVTVHHLSLVCFSCPSLVDFALCRSFCVTPLDCNVDCVTDRGRLCAMLLDVWDITDCLFSDHPNLFVLRHPVESSDLSSSSEVPTMSIPSRRQIAF